MPRHAAASSAGSQPSLVYGQDGIRFAIDMPIAGLWWNEKNRRIEDEQGMFVKV
jgi:hypothetical protein